MVTVVTVVFPSSSLPGIHFLLEDGCSLHLLILLIDTILMSAIFLGAVHPLYYETDDAALTIR